MPVDGSGVNGVDTVYMRTVTGGGFASLTSMATDSPSAQALTPSEDMAVAANMPIILFIRILSAFGLDLSSSDAGGQPRRDAQPEPGVSASSRRGMWIPDH